MSEQKKHYRMPAWIWKLPPRILNGEDKRFLAFLWWSGFHTCFCHNRYLAEKFGCSKRNIRRRISKLNQLKFISIGQPNNYLRTLYPRPIKDPAAWFAAMMNLKRVSSQFRTRK